MTMDAALPARLDLRRLSENLGGDQSFVREMLVTYLNVAAQAMSMMENAERAQDINSWLKTAHKLKGASLNITAKRLANLCVEAEQIKSLPHEQSCAMLFHMHKELAHLQAEISKESGEHL